MFSSITSDQANSAYAQARTHTIMSLNQNLDKESMPLSQPAMLTKPVMMIPPWQEMLRKMFWFLPLMVESFNR